MASRKMLIALMTLSVFLLMTGIGSAEIVVPDEAETVLTERLKQEGFDPTREDIVAAANQVLTELRTQHEDVESLIAAIKEDPNLVARISELAADHDDSESDPDDIQDPSGDEIDLEEPEDEEDGPGNWAPRERAIQRLQEHLERGLPVENALAAVTKEKHRLRWAEREGLENDDLDEDADEELEDIDDEMDENDDDVDELDDPDELPEEPDEDSDLADDTKQSKLERIEEKSEAKVEKELAKRERKLEKEKAKQEKREKKEEGKKARKQEKGGK